MNHSAENLKVIALQYKGQHCQGHQRGECFGPVDFQSTVTVL